MVRRKDGKKEEKMEYRDVNEGTKCLGKDGESEWMDERRKKEAL